MAHHTKDKGDLGVAKAFADLVEQGFLVLFPSTEHAPFDLVAYAEETFLRVQVKYRTCKRGAVEVKFSTSWADAHGSHTRKIDKPQVDVVCVYCPDTNECYYVWPRNWAESVTLRITPALNGNVARVTLASSCRKLIVGDRPRQESLVL